MAHSECKYLLSSLTFKYNKLTNFAREISVGICFKSLSLKYLETNLVMDFYVFILVKDLFDDRVKSCTSMINQDVFMCLIYY